MLSVWHKTNETETTSTVIITNQGTHHRCRSGNTYTYTHLLWSCLDKPIAIFILWSFFISLSSLRIITFLVAVFLFWSDAAKHSAEKVGKHGTDDNSAATSKGAVVSFAHTRLKNEKGKADKNCIDQGPKSIHLRNARIHEAAAAEGKPHEDLHRT